MILSLCSYFATTCSDTQQIIFDPILQIFLVTAPTDLLDACAIILPLIRCSSNLWRFLHRFWRHGAARLYRNNTVMRTRVCRKHEITIRATDVSPIYSVIGNSLINISHYKFHAAPCVRVRWMWSSKSSVHTRAESFECIERQPVTPWGPSRSDSRLRDSQGRRDLWARLGQPDLEVISYRKMVKAVTSLVGAVRFVCCFVLYNWTFFLINGTSCGLYLVLHRLVSLPIAQVQQLLCECDYRTTHCTFTTNHCWRPIGNIRGVELRSNGRAEQRKKRPAIWNPRKCR